MKNKQTRRDTGRHLCPASSGRCSTTPASCCLARLTQGLVGLLVYWKTREPIYLVLAMHDDCRQPWPLRGHPQGRSGKHRRLRDGAALGALLHRCRHDPGLLRRPFLPSSAFMSPDTFGEIAAISMVLASTITIAGRNFGSPRRWSPYCRVRAGADRRSG